MNEYHGKVAIYRPEGSIKLKSHGFKIRYDCTVEFEKDESPNRRFKGVCANYGLGNDGNEFKIITQVFLYKFMNDKFTS